MKKYFFLFSLLLHFALLFIGNNEKESSIVRRNILEPAKDLQIVIYDKKNIERLNKTARYLGKNNFYTKRESKLKQGIADILQEPLKGLLNKMNKKFMEGTRDYLPDVRYGDVMSLNTRAFKYYGFYERVERVLAPFWEYKVRKLIEDKPEIFKNKLTKDYVVDVKVFLNKDGELVKIIFLRSSNVREYDKLCERTFIELSPFLNPPRFLLKNGFISMNWRFILSLVKGFSFKLVPF